MLSGQASQGEIVHAPECHRLVDRNPAPRQLCCLVTRAQSLSAAQHEADLTSAFVVGVPDSISEFEVDRPYLFSKKKGPNRSGPKLSNSVKRRSTTLPTLKLG